MGNKVTRSTCLSDAKAPAPSPGKSDIADVTRVRRRTVRPPVSAPFGVDGEG